MTPGTVAVGPGTPVVRAADALGLVQAALGLAETDGGGAVAVGVVDGTGELVAFVRDDGAPLRAVRIAVMKACTAARFGRDTAAVADSLRRSGRTLADYGDRRFTALAGGVPLVDDRGRTAGGLGVSGRAPEEDHDLAVAALAGFRGGDGRMAADGRVAAVAGAGEAPR